MTPEEILDDMRMQITREKRPRVFAGGLLPAFCDFLLDLEHPENGYANWDSFVTEFPLITEKTNTLTVLADGKNKTIRPHYNKVADYFVVTHERPDYPSAAPHATGQWRDYMHWLESLVTFSPETLRNTSEAARNFVLEILPRYTFDPAEISRSTRFFELLIENFPWNDRATSERTGAAFQALVFGYIRANSPHLQVETRKVRVGGSRVDGVGDVDAWEGRQLVSTAEVKHFTFTREKVTDITSFIRKSRERNAHGMLVALDFGEGAVELLSDEGVRAVSKTDILREVKNWDPRKQDIALKAFEYAIARIEKSAGLVERFDRFIEEINHTPGTNNDPDTEV